MLREFLRNTMLLSSRWKKKVSEDSYKNITDCHDLLLVFNIANDHDKWCVRSVSFGPWLFLCVKVGKKMTHDAHSVWLSQRSSHSRCPLFFTWNGVGSSQLRNVVHSFYLGIEQRPKELPSWQWYHPLTKKFTTSYLKEIRHIMFYNCN